MSCGEMTSLCLEEYRKLTFGNLSAKDLLYNVSIWQDKGVSRKVSSEMRIPRELVFNTDSLVSIVAYSLLFLIAAVGNLTVFMTLFNRQKAQISRVSVFIMHLSISDLIVTLVMLPMEIGWHATVAWKAGDAMCRILMFFRTFGFYLSSFILIAISLDRYFAVKHPFSVSNASQRGKMMILFAWLFAFIASIPQSVIFHVEEHPMYKWFTQCVTFHFFPTPRHEMAYNIFNVFMLYLIPLIAIIFCYSCILWEMSKKSKMTNLAHDATPPSQRKKLCRNDSLRCSGPGRLNKARVHTLRMTIVIVVVFIVCWTPYFLILALWWIHREIAETIDPKIQRGLFIFAVSNSCMNPIVYGMFNTVFRREIKRKFKRLISCPRDKQTSHRKRQFRQNQFKL